AEVAAAEGLRHGQRHLRLGFDDTRAHLLHAGQHFLFDRHGGGAPHFGLRLRDEFVRFGLFGLQSRADVLAHIDVGDVNGQNFKRRVAVERLAQDRFGNAVGMFEHVLVTGRRADGGDNAFADARDDRLFRRTTDETVQVRADGHARLGLYDDAVLGHTVDRDFARRGIRTINDFRVDRRFHRFEDGLAGLLSGEVNGASAVELEVDSGLAGHDQRANDHFDVAAGEEMGVELIDADVQAGLDRIDAAVHDQSDGNLAQPEREQLGVADAGAGHQR